jgi:hypothetical protein
VQVRQNLPVDRTKDQECTVGDKQRGPAVP